MSETLFWSVQFFRRAVCDINNFSLSIQHVHQSSSGQTLTFAHCVIFVSWNWKWNGNGHIFVKCNGIFLQNGNEIQTWIRAY